MTAFDRFPPATPNLPKIPTPPVVVTPPVTPPVVVVPPMDYTKSWITLLGGLLSTLIPVILDMSKALPEPLPAVISVVGWLVTYFFTRQIPNKPLATVQPAPPPQK